MAVLVRGEIFQANRRFSAVVDFPVGETDLAGLVVEIEPFECVAVENFEIAILELNRIRWRKPRFIAVNDKRRVNNRKTFREIRVLAEEAAAVANRKYSGNEVEAVLITTLVDCIESAKEVRRLCGKSVQAAGKNRAIKVVFPGGFEKFGNLGDIAVLVEVPTENPDKLRNPNLDNGTLGQLYACDIPPGLPSKLEPFTEA